MKSSIVRSIKKYNHVHVANALWKLGYGWRNPKHRPTNVERMVNGLPRQDLVLVLAILERQ